MTKITNGTEKQINWANDIRTKALNQIREYYAQKTSKLAELDARIEQFASRIPTDAAWWIENRYCFGNWQSTMDTLAKVMR